MENQKETDGMSIVPISHHEDFLKWLAPYTHSAPLQREEHIEAYRSRLNERRQRLVRDHYERMREIDPEAIVSEPFFHQIGVKPPTVAMTEEEAIEFGFLKPIEKQGKEEGAPREPCQRVHASDEGEGPRGAETDYTAVDWNDQSLPIGERMRAWMAQKGRQTVMEGMKEAGGESMGLEAFKRRRTGL